MPASVGTLGVTVHNPYGVPAPFFGYDLYNAPAVVTLAQLNAGYTLVAAAPSFTLRVVDFLIIPTGTFTTATDIRLSDTTATPVDIATLVIANATNNNVVQPGATGLTLNAGFGVPLTANQGLQIRKTGSSAAGGTSLLVLVRYMLK